ncbi:RNA polymerase sigma factor [Dyadobacter sp. 50-39]|uniref:RNA polymerase sigma factor n=1 Tax=Dyadobacter sp. 50-39 TaxID=1895756 RepID=UPI0025BECE30|nr:sigma-70 family RNA polymerase sigma factor [Dyadobacter sp. 50-39]
MLPSPDSEDNTRHDEQDDEVFLRSAVHHDSKAGMELLYNRYYAALCTHAVKFVGSREIAEDLVSDIFFKFYSGKIFERITTSYRAYLFRTVRNEGYNYLKREATTRKIELNDLTEVTGSDSQQPDNITQYEELYQDVEKAIATLPRRQKSIYLLFHFEGKSLTEIANEFSISARTAEVHVYRARNTVRALIRNKWFISILIAITTL